MKYTLSIVLTLTIFTTTLNIHNQHHKTSPKTKFHKDPKAK